MKFLFIVCSILTLHFAIAGEGGGWGSSGGGFNKSDINNPWFYQDFFERDKPKTWCILHGGPSNFSLSKKNAKIQIEKAISLITNRIKNKWPRQDVISYHTEFNRYFPGLGESPEVILNNIPDGAVDSGVYKKLATRFTYQSECLANTDLKFLLGVTRGKLFSRLIKRFPSINYKRTAGIAIRTHYTNPTINNEVKKIGGRGLIWISPDKGDFSYTGDRGHYFTSIWDKPNYTASEFQELNLHPSIKLQDVFINPFVPVILHELGHVFGYRHVKTGIAPKVFDMKRFLIADDHYLMDEDFPVSVIAAGMISKRALKNSLNIFGNSSMGKITQDSNMSSNKKFRIGKKLPFSFYYDDGMPNSLVLDDTGLNTYFDNAIGVEFEFSHNQNDPAKMRIVNYNLDILDTNGNPNETLSFKASREVSLHDVSFEDETPFQFVPFINHFDPSNPYESGSFDDFLTLFKRTMLFNFQLSGQRYIALQTEEQIRFFNLTTGKRTKFKFAGTLYRLFGKQVESLPLPLPLKI